MGGGLLQSPAQPVVRTAPQRSARAGRYPGRAEGDQARAFDAPPDGAFYAFEIVIDGFLHTAIAPVMVAALSATVFVSRALATSIPI